jgi:hypothetical protein
MKALDKYCFRYMAVKEVNFLTLMRMTKVRALLFSKVYCPKMSYVSKNSKKYLILL